MRSEDSIILLEKLLEMLSEIPPSKIKDIHRLVKNERNRLMHSQSNLYSYKTNLKTTQIRIDKEKKELIGSVPYILTNKEFFPNNESIVQFAKQIGIIIPSWQKKKKDEILGRIISEILRFEPKKLSQFNFIINNFLNKAEKGQVDNFFLEWDRAIRDMNFKP